MEIFNFSDFDNESLALRKRNYSMTYKIVCVVLIIFFVKFVVVYGYKNFIPLFVALYLLVLSIYSITFKITKNSYLSSLNYYSSLLCTFFVMLFMSGGIKAPGNLWLSIFPFLGAHLLGRRGFLFGVVIVSTSLFLLIGLSYFQIEMYPFVSTESFQREFRTNLLVFTYSTFYITYTHVSSEVQFINELNHMKERNENLLKILFHDLANPMQMIQMLVKKFSSNRSPEDTEKIFLQLTKTSKRIVDVLEHVRKMKSIEDRKIVLDLKSIQLYDNFSIIHEMFQEKLEEKKLELIIQNDSSDEIQIFADPVYFTHQILANIISNSIKFTEMNKKIYCSWMAQDKDVTIIIRDEGIGMPADILKNLFDQNKHVSRKGTQGELGTGYGMPLMKTFIEEFGGKVEVSSIEKSSEQQTEHGTTFKLTMLKA